MEKKRQVIIGNSAAGLTAAISIRRHDPHSVISIISDEDCPAYSRVLTTYYLEGKIGRDQLYLCDLSFYDRFCLQPFLGHRAVGLDVGRQKVLLDRGPSISFDNLLIATGASPVFPDIPGIGLKGVFGLRTLADAEAMREWCKESKEVVILGAGLVGLQVANALWRRNLRLTVVVKSPQVLSQMLDPEAASIIERAMKEKGVRVLKGREAQEIRGDEGGAVREIVLEDGELIPAQMVVVGKGVRPNLDLAMDAGIGTRTGILVDPQMRTTIPNIYAAGDVAEGLDFLTGQSGMSAIWPTAVAQGEVAGLNMAGVAARSEGSIGRNVTHLFGQVAAALGMARSQGEGFEAFSYCCPEDNVYRRLVFREGFLVGASLVNRTEDAGFLYSVIRARRKLEINREAIRFPLGWGSIMCRVVPR